MKRLIIQSKDDYEEEQLKDKSVSIEMKMIIDDASSVSPFIKMFTLDDFRDMDYEEIESIILDNSKHIARSFSLALLHRQDCLNGNTKPTSSTGADE